VGRAAGTNRERRGKKRLSKGREADQVKHFNGFQGRRRSRWCKTEIGSHGKDLTGGNGEKKKKVGV